ncbi:MAG: hypothetical protein HY951_11365 [Bacteroidia bacterium]|nr:hypothetical protein [Bacteroidia bacterium]
MRNFLILSLGILLFTCCNQGNLKSDNSLSADNLQNKSVTVNKDSIILELTIQVLTSIKNNNFNSFAKFIHPALGVRFSPYAFIDTIKDVKLSSSEFADLVKKQNAINWGSYDGSGDIISLNINEYFKKFVYSADFLNAEKKELNKIICTGNTINNIDSVYKNCDFTENHFSGIDKKFEGIDWCSLRLVYKKYNDNYYLVGVIHDQWTI